MNAVINIPTITKAIKISQATLSERYTATVRYKPEYGFSPENYREREIPIPAKLVRGLKAWRASADKNCRTGLPYCRMQAQARLPGLPETAAIHLSVAGSMSMVLAPRGVVTVCTISYLPGALSSATSSLPSGQLANAWRPKRVASTGSDRQVCQNLAVISAHHNQLLRMFWETETHLLRACLDRQL